MTFVIIYESFQKEEVDRIDSRKELTRMMEQYMNLIFSICVKMTNDYFAAEDLTQETFLSALKNLSSFDGENEKAWLCRIASNKCIDYNRQAAKRFVPAEDQMLKEKQSDQGLPEPSFLELEAREQLVEACGRLKPPYDVIARLYFVEEYKADEIAQLQQKNLKTVQTQIYRARGMLRKIYGKERG